MKMMIFPWKWCFSHENDDFPMKNHPFWGTPNYDVISVGDFLSTPFAVQLSSDCHLLVHPNPLQVTICGWKSTQMVPMTWKFPMKNHGFVQGVFIFWGGWDYLVSGLQQLINPTYRILSNQQHQGYNIYVCKVEWTTKYEPLISTSIASIH